MAWYDYSITQPFKWTDTHRTWHSGIDIGAPWNTAVTAPLAGTVVFAQCQPWGGQVDVLVNYGQQNYVVTFLHLHSIMVNRGQSVARGQLLGYSGGDGRGPCPTQMPKYSNGPHIHFELTLGSVGPYHGGPPYKVSASSFTVDPTPLYRTLNQQEALPGASPDVAALSEALPGAGASETIVNIPSLDTIFGIPQATVDAVNAVPGVDGLIYKLHEVETFPGWKSLDQIAPLPSVASILGGTVAGVASAIPGVAAGAAGAVFGPGGVAVAQNAGKAAAAAGAAASGVAGTLSANLNPGRLVYWIAGNLIGNARAAFVRLLYLMIGGLLFVALVIAIGSAQAENALDTAKEIAPLVAEAAVAAA